MRGIRKIVPAVVPAVVPAIVLCGLAGLLLSGCAASGAGGVVGGGGAAFMPVSPVAIPDVQKANWPQFGYDEGHSAYNPLEKTIGTTNVAKLKIAWNDQTIIQPSGIVYDDDALYVDDM